MTAAAPLPPRLERTDVDLTAAPDVAPVRALSQVLECTQRPGLVRHALCQEVLRTHTDYLELLGDMPLPTGCLLECWVDLPGAPRKFLLVGRVIHGRRDSTGAWLVQLALTDHPGTDLDAWRRQVA